MQISNLEKLRELINKEKADERSGNKSFLIRRKTMTECYVDENDKYDFNAHSEEDNIRQLQKVARDNGSGARSVRESTYNYLKKLRAQTREY